MMRTNLTKSNDLGGDTFSSGSTGSSERGRQGETSDLQTTEFTGKDGERVRLKL